MTDPSSTLRALVAIASSLPGVESIGLHNLDGKHNALITLTGPGSGPLVRSLGGIDEPWQPTPMPELGLGEQRHVHATLEGLDLHAVELRRDVEVQ
jgi:hypothetical protein